MRRWLLPFAVLASGALAATPLHQVNATLYQTEHCLFVIDATVTWANPATAYNDIYVYNAGLQDFPKLHGYYDQLVANCPGNYFSVCYIANTGDSHVPNYIDRTFKASGINETNTAGPAFTYPTVDMCRYNESGGSVGKTVLGVYDHELGHAWGARAFYTLNQPSLSDGHWLYNSTVDCQMSATYSPDGGVTVNKLYGDPVNGFHWQSVDNGRDNDYSTFSDQTLYLLGVRETWPTAYVLNNVAYNPDGTAGSSSVLTFDHAGLIAAYGPRSPDFKTSQKHFKLGFVYIARDLAEVNTVYQNVEASAAQFCDGEAIDPVNFRSQTPFLADTKFRASVDGRLADLDGNATPTLTVTDPDVTSGDGSAVINFTAADPDGPAPTVSVVPASSSCTISGSTVQVTGLPDGVHFFTLKAVDAGGKKAFGHFTVEVQRPVSATAITSQPVRQTVTAGNAASFSVTATGSPANFSYQWFRQAARTSTWNVVISGGSYAGASSATLTVAADTTMDGDAFLCMVDNGNGVATSLSAKLVVNETAPVLGVQPADAAVPSTYSVPFTVAVVGGSTTFGYFHYQWQLSTDGGLNWTDLVNGGPYTTCTSATMRVAVNLGLTGSQYRCRVSNTAGSTASNAATLTVGLVPVVTTQPQPATFTALTGQTVSFNAIVSGTGPLTYLWSRFSTPVPGNNSPTLTLVNVAAADAGGYTVYVTNAYGVTRSNPCFLTVSPAAVRGDLNGDHKADIVWENTVTGDRGFWLMNGTAFGSWFDLGIISPAWRIAGTGDFNRDGKLDILWENTASGERYVWLMNGTAFSAGVSLGVVSTDWRIAALADFNADGYPDILWQNTVTGDCGFWLMNGTSFSSWVDMGVVATDWRIAAAGDFNGDAKPDILWENTTTGQHGFWLMNGTTFGSWSDLGVLGTDWRAAGAGDYNGDGQNDILWENTVTGERGVWRMNGTVFASWKNLGVVANDWRIAD